MAVIVLVNVLVSVGMLLIVPLGLSMLLVPGRHLWPYGAAAGAISLWLPRGAPATALAAIYAAMAAALCVYAVRRLTTALVLPGRTGLVLPGRTGRALPGRTGRALPGRTGRALPGRGLPALPAGAVSPARRWPAEVAVFTALVSPAVAASSLVAERAGHHLFGFKLGVLLLTVAHFHFAGFAAALIAGLHCRIVPGRWADAAALTVPAGTMLVLAGYFISDYVELAGALVLTAGMWTVGWLTWHWTRAQVRDRTTAVLLGTSAVVLAASMILAVSWALGEATGLPHPSLAWMAATHGVANALGFALCALLGWRRVLRDRPGDPRGPDRLQFTGAKPGSHLCRMPR